MSEVSAPTAAQKVSAAVPSIALQAATASPEDHVKAARCHEMAAALHHEAARFYAGGDSENAVECVKQAIEHGTRAMQLAAKCLGAAPH